MFDLNIDHYEKNELEDLFDLKSQVYTNDDLDRNMANLQNKIELDKKIDSQTKERTLNFLLTAKNILLDTTPNLLTNHVIEQGENFLIQKPKQNPRDVGYTDEPYYRSNLNPVQRRITEVLVNVDSRFRDDQKSISTDFTISFPNLIKNVISMQVQTVEEIGGFLQISDKLKNNFFHYQIDSGAIQRLTIPDGNYTIDTLSTTLGGAGTFNVSGNKLTYQASGDTRTLYFNKTWNGDDDALPNLRQKLGWIMGHTEETLIVEDGTTHTFTNNAQIKRVNYASLVVDDFQNNFYQTIINGTNSYVQNSNILSRLGNINSTKHTQNDSPERKYFGPVDLQKLKIQLVDEFGRTVDLNGNELSFSILLKTQYDM
tara:strand:- start:5736 stop:6848 length:1113 start_codon:yes stop_codon:yes gene_type:complete